jgi:hypothetical protein
VFDRDDLWKLESRGLKQLEAKKLQRWCDAVCARAENMLPSSLNTPSGSALLSSEELNVLTLPAPSVTVAEVVLDNESLRDGDEESGEGYPEEDDDDSDNNLEIVVQKSGTADSTGVSSGGPKSQSKRPRPS